MPATTANLILNLDHSPNTTHAYRDTDHAIRVATGKNKPFGLLGPASSAQALSKNFHKRSSRPESAAAVSGRSDGAAVGAVRCDGGTIREGRVNPRSFRNSRTNLDGVFPLNSFSSWNPPGTLLACSQIEDQYIVDN